MRRFDSDAGGAADNHGVLRSEGLRIELVYGRSGAPRALRMCFGAVLLRRGGRCVL